MILFGDKLYDRLKFIAQILLPALGTLYFTLAGLWSLPAGEQVVGTIVAVDTFLGVMLGLSTQAYQKSDVAYDGSIDVKDEDDRMTYLLQLDNDPEKLKDKTEVRFRVNPTHREARE